MKKIIILVLSLGLAGVAFAESDKFPLTEREIPQDQASIKKGAMIYYNLCRICHDMKYIRFRHLQDIGFSKKEVDKLRGKQLATEKFRRLMSDKNSTTLFGMVAPDLSVMAKARDDGAQYIYTLMTSYYAVSDTSYDNKFFPKVRMPDVFAISLAQNNEEKIVIENKAKDVSAFLLWASDPRAEERKSLGVYVILYLIVLSIMFYFLMKRVWARLDN